MLKDFTTLLPAPRGFGIKRSSQPLFVDANFDDFAAAGERSSERPDSSRNEKKKVLFKRVLIAPAVPDYAPPPKTIRMI